MKWYVALGLAFIVCGTVMSTGAAPLSEPVDDLAPAADTGVALAPADTPNGDRYASFDSNGELVISVDVVSSTKTLFDDVFVVGFSGVTGSDEAATLRLEHDSEWLDIYRNADAGTRESVDEAGNTMTLEPGEQATLGFVVTTDADSPGSLSETVTYMMEVPDAESSTGGGGSSAGGGGSGGSSGGNGGGGSSGESGGDTDASGGGDTDPDNGGSDGGSINASDGNETDAGSSGEDTNVSGGGGGGSGDSPDEVTPTDEPTETPASGGGGGGSTGVETSTDEPTETPTDSEEETETVAGGGAAPVPSTSESQQSAEPSGFALDLDPAFGIGWGPWALMAGLLAVATNYLVQTRYHDVLPVLQTQPSNRRHRFRHVAVREAAVGLAGIVLTVLVVSAASSAGFGPVPQLVTALAFSAAVGTGTGYRLVPELDSLPEPHTTDDGDREH